MADVYVVQGLPIFEQGRNDPVNALNLANVRTYALVAFGPFFAVDPVSLGGPVNQFSQSAALLLGAVVAAVWGDHKHWAHLCRVFAADGPAAAKAERASLFPCAVGFQLGDTAPIPVKAVIKTFAAAAGFGHGCVGGHFPGDCPAVASYFAPDCPEGFAAVQPLLYRIALINIKVFKFNHGLPLSLDRVEDKYGLVDYGRD
jgi:hypothetical protein